MRNEHQAQMYNVKKLDLVIRLEKMSRLNNPIHT